jgi:hypothetical protein
MDAPWQIEPLGWLRAPQSRYREARPPWSKRPQRRWRKAVSRQLPESSGSGSMSRTRARCHSAGVDG